MQRTSFILLVSALALGSAQAQEKFQRKSGLWELRRTSTVTAGQVRTYQMCVDQASDNALSPLADGSPGEVCDVSKLQRNGDKLSIDAACKMPQSGALGTTHAVVSGKFDSAYKVESKTKFEPPIRGHPESDAVLEAKWTGPCKPNQRPGDVIGPRGEKSNLDNQKPVNSTRAAREKSQEGDKQQSDKPQRRKRGGYVPTPEAPGSPATPAVPPPGTTTK